MKLNYLSVIGVTTATMMVSCAPVKKEYASYELYPVRTGSLTRNGVHPREYYILALVTNS